jgi:hypothetical protein
MSKKLNRFLAMENEAIVEERLEETAAPAEAAAEELGEVEEALDTSLDVHQELSTLADQVQADSEAGVLSEEALGYANALAKRHLKKVGLEQLGTGFESSYSQEGIGQRLKDLWNMIVKVVSEFLAKINDFIQTHLTRAGYYVKRAKSLTEKLKTANFKTGNMPANGLKALYDNQGELLDPVIGSARLLRAVDHSVSDGADAGIARMEKMAELLKGVKYDDSESFYGSIRDSVIREILATSDDYITKEGARVTHKDGIEISKIGPVLFGDRSVMTVMIKPDYQNSPDYTNKDSQQKDIINWNAKFFQQVPTMLASYSLVTERFRFRPVEPKFKEVPALTKEVAIDVVDNVQKAAEKILSYRTRGDKVKRAIETLKSAADHFSDNSDKAAGLGEKEKAAAAALLRISQHVIRGSQAFMTSVVKWAIPNIGHCLDYAERSIQK